MHDEFAPKVMKKNIGSRGPKIMHQQGVAEKDVPEGMPESALALSTAFGAARGLRTRLQSLYDQLKTSSNVLSARGSGHCDNGEKKDSEPESVLSVLDECLELCVSLNEVANDISSKVGE